MYGDDGVVAALHERNITGIGRVVRRSLLAAIVGVYAFQGTRYTVAGEVPQAQVNRSISPQTVRNFGLNTAALSLFIALHLAVEPLVPCLVFDDPVLAMDEVHVAQFAALVRTLSKRHKRQVIIAVHERELFQYLALELSPAFEGDELITIELGERSEDEDGGISRSTWAPDPSIAV